VTCSINCYGELHYTECHYAECPYAEGHYAECHYADCHYAECHYAECRVQYIVILNLVMPIVAVLNVIMQTVIYCYGTMPSC
jgi:hypothetical protein